MDLTSIQMALRVREREHLPQCFKMFAIANSFPFLMMSLSGYGGIVIWLQVTNIFSCIVSHFFFVVQQQHLLYKNPHFLLLFFLYVYSYVSSTIEYFCDLYNPLDNPEPFLHHWTQLREDNLLCCSVAKSCLALPTPHQASLFFTISWSLLEFMSIESVMLSNHLAAPSPFAFSLSQHQGLFQWVCSSHQLAKVLLYLVDYFILGDQLLYWTFLGIV